MIVIVENPANAGFFVSSSVLTHKVKKLGFIITACSSTQKNSVTLLGPTPITNRVDNSTNFAASKRKQNKVPMENSIVNKVAESALLSVDLESFYPSGEPAVFDVKNYLFRGLILKEKDFRMALTTIDWEAYRDKHVAVTCSADAIVPVWAYMLVTVRLQPVARSIVFGDEQNLVQTLLLQNINNINPAEYMDKRIVIKGCGDKEVAEAAYVAICNKLLPVVKSIMYGEPCSTVPVYKKR